MSSEKGSIEKADAFEANIAPVFSSYHENDKGDIMLNNGLKAGLKTYSINLIALAGIIGPGALIGLGSFLKASGPAGMIAGWTIVCLIVVPMMFYIGEMNSIYSSNFASLGSRFVSKGFGASIALSYVILWITNMIAEYTSLTASLETYSTTVPTWGWYLIMWAFFTVFQLLNVSWWGEVEAWLAIVKILFISGFYIFAIIFAAGGIPGHSPGNPFKNYPLNHGFKGIVDGFVYAGVYMSGIESVSVLATETRNIKKAIPGAVQKTMIRIIYVYYGLTIAYGITVPYNDASLNNANKVLKSPMVIALTEAGWANSKYYITTVILVICVSSINSSIYLASRALFQWSADGYGPKIFTKVTERGVPWLAIHFCHLFGFLSILSYSAGSSVAYAYIVNVTGVAAFIVWTAICVTHLRFRTFWLQAGRLVTDLPYVAMFYPYGNYFTIFIGILLTLVQGWGCFKPFDYKSFIDAYILIPAFFICWAIYDLWYFKAGFVKFQDVDLDFDRRPDLDDVDESEIDHAVVVK